MKAVDRKLPVGPTSGSPGWQSFAIDQNRRTLTAQGEWFVVYEHQSGSADGRFELQVEAWEARNTHWVFAPRLRDTTNGRVLFQPTVRAWSTDGSTWTGNQVRIVLRKYPGDQQRPCLTAVVDCEREVGCVEGGEAVLLRDLEVLLDRALAEPA